jgi:colicin import membrane protein
MNCTKCRYTLWKRVSVAMIAGLMLIGDIALAQGAAPATSASASADAVTLASLVAHYPSGSIQSTETANQALAEVANLRAALDRKLTNEQRDCYTHFFATSCVDAAKENHRLALVQIRKIEVEADTFNRSARVVERDKHLAEKRAADASNHPKLPTDQARSTSSGDSTPSDAPPTAHPQGDRIAEHEAKMKQLQGEASQDAQKRADNVAAYEKKVQDAEARQRDVAEKKAEKAKQAAAKAAAAASAPAASTSAANTKP